MNIVSAYRQYIKLRNVRFSESQNVIGNNRKMKLIYVKVTRKLVRFNVEDLTDILTKDGSKSWDVIFVVADRHVTDLSTEWKQSMHSDDEI